jgi:cell division protein FtsX
MAGLHAHVRGTLTQHTLTHRRSIAALSLGLGMKGARRWITSTGIVFVAIAILVVSETVQVVAVARRRFMQVH